MCNYTRPPSSASATSPPLPTRAPCGPDSPITQAAYTYALTHLHPSILYHSLRVYLYAREIATSKSTPTGLPPDLLLPPLDLDGDILLFVTALFHDMGTSSSHDGEQRFEICGADAAAKFLRSHAFDEAFVREVRVAIAVHTSPGIAEFLTPLSRALRQAVLLDFGRPGEGDAGLVDSRTVDRAEAQFPRGGIEKVLGDTVVEQGLRRPGKAPKVSWPGVMVAASLAEPRWEGVNKAF